MQLPANLKNAENAIRDKIEEFEGKLTYDEVIKWILQFSPEHQFLAIKIFLNVHFITYNNVMTYCNILYNRLPTKVMRGVKKGEVAFSSLGNVPKSGAMLIYHYGLTNNVPDEICTNLGAVLELIRERKNIKYLVFVDDFIGSGNQASAFLADELIEELSIAGIEHISLHAAVGFIDGKEKIEKKKGIEVELGYVLSEKDMVFHEASTSLTNDAFEQKRYKNILLDYGKKLRPNYPLGYGDSQALIAFFYNTPNNTLPVIWVDEEGWQPLLERFETHKQISVTDESKIILLILFIIGGKCLYPRLRALTKKIDLGLKKEIESLNKCNFIKEKVDGSNILIELTNKGEARASDLLNNDISNIAFSILIEYHEVFIKKHPYNTKDRFKILVNKITEFTSIITKACQAQNLNAVIKLHKISSWLLLKIFDIDTRLKLGEDILSSFDKKELGDDWGWIKIDEIGWSYVVMGKYRKAHNNLCEGIGFLYACQDIFGFSQGFRHIQGLKIRNKRYFDADFCLRILFGLSCAIPEKKDRILMQAGIFKGLANSSLKTDREKLAEKFKRNAELLYKEIKDNYHINEVKEMKPEPLELPVDINSYGPRQRTIFLVRHPTALKNEKNTFGRQMLNAPTAAGSNQIKKGINKILKELSGVNENLEIYSAGFDITKVFAEQITNNLNMGFKIALELNSIDCGDLTAYNEKDATKYFPVVMKKLQAFRHEQLDGYNLVFPKGEFVRAFTVRLADFLLRKIYKDSGPKILLLVTHQSCITAIWNILTAIDRSPIDPSYRFLNVPLGSVTKIVIDNSTSTLSIKRL